MARRTKADREMENMIALMILIPIAILKGIGLIIAFVAKLIGFIIVFFDNIIKKRNEQKIYKDLLNIEVQEQLQKIDSLEGIQFEKYTGELLKKIGFHNVIVTKGSGDFGADIIAEKDGEKFAFQCKRFSSSIGPKPIGEVLRGMNKYKCTKGVVITNNYFSKQAVQEAQISNVELWDRNKLISLLASLKEVNNSNALTSTQNLIEACSNENTKTLKNDGDLINNLQNKTNTYAINLIENTEENIAKPIELIAGCYVANEDIDVGKYSIKVLSGIGNMVVEDNLGNIRVNECVGIQDGFINRYNNLRLKNDDVLEISGNVVLECTRIK